MNEISDEGPILPLWLPLTASVVLLVGLFLGYKVTKDDPRIGVGIMAGAVIPAAITALQFIRLRRALGMATLQTRDELVPLGWSGTVTYVRPLNGATVQSIEVRLQCEEHVEKGSGRGRRVWRRVVVDEALSPQTAPYATQLQVQIPIRIPAAGPPTFHYTDNEINWWVRLHLKMEGCPNTRSSFKLSVMPAVVGQ